MFQLDLKSRRSIYEQIIDNIKEQIIAGLLQPEDKLPSVRELSRMLTVNPNTIQKAYRELERQNYLYTVSGLGCFVCPPDRRTIDRSQIEHITETLEASLKELFYLGMSAEEIRSLLDRLLERRDNEE